MCRNIHDKRRTRKTWRYSATETPGLGGAGKAPANLDGVEVSPAGGSVALSGTRMSVDQGRYDRVDGPGGLSRCRGHTRFHRGYRYPTPTSRPRHRLAQRAGGRVEAKADLERGQSKGCR